MFTQMLELICFTESKALPNCKCDTTHNESSAPRSFPPTRLSENGKMSPFYEVPNRKFGLKIATGALNVLEKQPNHM